MTTPTVDRVLDLARTLINARGRLPAALYPGLGGDIMAKQDVRGVSIPIYVGRIETTDARDALLELLADVPELTGAIFDLLAGTVPESLVGRQDVQQVAQADAFGFVNILGICVAPALARAYAVQILRAADQVEASR